MKVSSLLLAPLLAAAAPLKAERRAVESLDQLYKRVGKIYLGAIAEQGKLQTGENANTIKSSFGQVTPEYSMKWKETEPIRNQFNFDLPDYLVDWAISNGKNIRGHALVWHEALPDWVPKITDRTELTKVIESHIAHVVGQWKGKIRAWDVVNEIFSEDGGFRDSVFYRVLGEDFVGIAFRAARKADPDARLYINDYNLDNADWAKLKALVRYVDKWKAQGIPIDGIGSQTHLAAGKAGPIEGALRALAAANVDEVAVTELDIEGASPAEYSTVVAACYHVPHCVGVTVWGIRDTDSWKASKTPLLFNNNWEPKDAYYAIRDYLRKQQNA